MKHQTLDQLHAVAEVNTQPVMSRTQRLVRWAELLEREPSRLLTALAGTEYRALPERDVMRGDGSPIAVAFTDPILHDEGLKDDSYGEAKRFFELTDWQLHRIVCYCHFGETVRAGSAARCVRSAVEPRTLLGRLRDFVFADAH